MTKATSARQAQKVVYNSAKERKFTKINVRPTRQDYNLLNKEIQEPAVLEHVVYEVVDDNGYLAEVIGDVRYLTLTNLLYDTPTEKPSLVHKDTENQTSAKDCVELKAKMKKELSNGCQGSDE